VPTVFIPALDMAKKDKDKEKSKSKLKPKDAGSIRSSNNTLASVVKKASSTVSKLKRKATSLLSSSKTYLKRTKDRPGSHQALQLTAKALLL
jgi:hypothetical protein